MGAIIYSEQPPPAALARWIECIWRVETRAPVQNYQVLPDGCLDIVFSRERGVQAVGAMTAERRFDQPAGSLTTGIRFRPGMAGTFLSVSPAELTDCVLPLVDLSVRGFRAITEIPIPAAPPNPVQRALEYISSTHGQSDLEYVARQSNLSPRQFRRRCFEESGLTPNRLCRILRFRRACVRAAGFRGQRPDWASIALDCGYFDQAHMIRDFREFSGQAPMSLFSNTLRLASAYDGLHEDYARSDC